MNKNSVNEIPVSGNVNRICEGTEIKGTIKAATDYRIDGSVDGSIRCEGKLIIGDKGFFKGEISSKNIEVSGKVEGTITAEALLTLKTTAVIIGDIIAGKLVIEVGAKFDGNCKMSKQGVTPTSAPLSPQSK